MDRIKPFIFPLAVFAALLYNMWPLGYILDPGVLHNSYVSVLEVSGKPYAWLFVLGDILTGVVVITVGTTTIKIRPLSRVIMVGYITFGIATLIDAIIPISSHCEASISACGISPSQVLSPHDIASILAAFGLFYSLLKTMRLFRGDSPNLSIYKWVSFTYWIWCITGTLLIMSVVTGDFSIISQAFFLVACGLALAVVPAALKSER